MGIDSHQKSLQKQVHSVRCCRPWKISMSFSIPLLTRLGGFGPKPWDHVVTQRRFAPWSQVASVAKATSVATGIPEEVAEGKAHSGAPSAQDGSWKGGQRWVARLWCLECFVWFKCFSEVQTWILLWLSFGILRGIGSWGYPPMCLELPPTDDASNGRRP